MRCSLKEPTSQKKREKQRQTWALSDRWACAGGYGCAVGACDGPATCGVTAEVAGFLTSEGPAEADQKFSTMCRVCPNYLNCY